MSSGDPTSITLSEFYPYPVEKVWDVLVSLELTASQVNEVSDTPVETGQTRVVVTYPIPAADYDGVVRIAYTSVVPNEHIEYVMTATGIEVTSRWTLQSEPGGTRLRVLYTRFDPGNTQHRQWRTMLFTGCGPILTNLRGLLDEGH